MIKLLQISQQRDQLPVQQTSDQTATLHSQGDPSALIVLDWAIKSLNFQLDDKAADDADTPEPKHSPTKNALIYASYINVILANFDILHEPWHAITITPKLLALLRGSPGLGLPALVNLLGRLSRAILETPDGATKLAGKLAHYKELLGQIEESSRATGGAEGAWAELQIQCRCVGSWVRQKEEGKEKGRQEVRAAAGKTQVPACLS